MPDCLLTYLIGARTAARAGNMAAGGNGHRALQILVMMREGETRRTSPLWASRGAQIDFLDARERWISPRRRSENIYGRTSRFERLVPEAVADYTSRAAFTGKNLAWS